MKKKRTQLQPTTGKKNPAIERKEFQDRLDVVLEKLQQMKEYRQILQEDGMDIDHEDRKKLSDLICRKMRLEKQMSGRWLSNEEYQQKRQGKKKA